MHEPLVEGRDYTAEKIDLRTPDYAIKRAKAISEINDFVWYVKPVIEAETTNDKNQ